MTKLTELPSVQNVARKWSSGSIAGKRLKGSLMSNISVKEAISVIKDAMEDDPDYAHTWHCNVAMMCQDAMRSANHRRTHEIANDGASRFMKLLFGVETGVHD